MRGLRSSERIPKPTHSHLKGEDEAKLLAIKQHQFDHFLHLGEATGESIMHGKIHPGPNITYSTTMAAAAKAIISMTKARSMPP
jgi:hypothetical protein